VFFIGLAENDSVKALNRLIKDFQNGDLKTAVICLLSAVLFVGYVGPIVDISKNIS
jgi:hypothetical protein